MWSKEEKSLLPHKWQDNYRRQTERCWPLKLEAS